MTNRRPDSYDRSDSRTPDQRPWTSGRPSEGRWDAPRWNNEWTGDPRERDDWSSQQRNASPYQAGHPTPSYPGYGGAPRRGEGYFQGPSEPRYGSDGFETGYQRSDLPHGSQFPSYNDGNDRYDESSSGRTWQGPSGSDLSGGVRGSWSGYQSQNSMGNTGSSSRTSPYSSRPSSSGPFVGRGPRNYKRADDRIEDEIGERLSRHGAIDASDIEISVSNGVVTLSGEADSREARRLAEDIAEDITGVKQVMNQIKTRSHDGDRDSSASSSSSSSTRNSVRSGNESTKRNQ